MKKFFKSKLNIAIICQFLLGFILCLLGNVSIWFIVIGSFGLASACFTLAAKFHKSYNRRLEIDEEDNLFDARVYDYDEEIYLRPDATKEKPIRKKMFQKLDALTPAVMFYIVGAIFVFVAIRMIFSAL